MCPKFKKNHFKKYVTTDVFQNFITYITKHSLSNEYIFKTVALLKKPEVAILFVISNEMLHILLDFLFLTKSKGDFKSQPILKYFNLIKNFGSYVLSSKIVYCSQFWNERVHMNSYIGGIFGFYIDVCVFVLLFTGCSKIKFVLLSIQTTKTQLF